jgi:hypothetical protein
MSKRLISNALCSVTFLALCFSLSDAFAQTIRVDVIPAVNLDDGPGFISDPRVSDNGKTFVADTSSLSGLVWTADKGRKYLPFRPEDFRQDGSMVSTTIYTGEQINGLNVSIAGLWTREAGLYPVEPEVQGFAGVVKENCTQIGSFANYNTNSNQAFVWTLMDGFVRFPTPTGVKNSFPRAISTDGMVVSVVADGSSLPRGQAAFVWYPVSGQVLNMGSGFPAGISANGTFFAVNPGTNVAADAFLWSAAQGKTILGPVPGGSQFVFFDFIANDGNSARGIASSQFRSFPCIWTRSGGFSLGPNNQIQEAISKNFLHSVRFVTTGGVREVVKRSPSGETNISRLLAARGFTGINFTKVTFISEDGDTLVGYGDRNGQSSYLRVDLTPEAERISVTIDIIPSSTTNRFSLNSAGNLNVNVLSRAGFDEEPSYGKMQNSTIPML